jgi:hypothetical protein
MLSVAISGLLNESVSRNPPCHCRRSIRPFAGSLFKQQRAE